MANVLSNMPQHNMLAQAALDPSYWRAVRQGLADAMNRGLIGGIVGAPVDVANMALRPFGYGSENPVMGSEWIGQKMQNAGIVSGNRNALAEGLASFVDPATMGAGAAKLAGAVPAIVGMAKNSGKASDALRSSAKTQFEISHEIAQRNAALPVEQGGLGLPPNNTAMDRARAMGFQTAPSKQTYHGARGEIAGDIDPTRSDLGFHTGSLDQAENRLRAFGHGGVNFGEGANVIPLMVSKYANLLPVRDVGSFHADALAPQLEKKKILAKGKANQIVKDIEKDWKLISQYDKQMRDVLEQQGYGGVRYANKQEGAGTSFAFTDPTLIRSRFAAFDPMQRNSANILAGGVAGAIGLPLYFNDTNK